MNKNRKNTAILILVIALLFYVAAAIGFVTGQSYSVMFMLMGSVMLLLGVATSAKLKKEAEENKDNEK